jgi:hypothetical protein
MYRIYVDKQRSSGNIAWDNDQAWEQWGLFTGDRNDAIRYLQDLVKRLKKEPYLAPRFEGEEPLPGLEAPQ